MVEIGWGRFADSEYVGTPFSSESDFKDINFDKAMDEEYKSFKHAAHGMIYAKLPGKLWDMYPRNATALMQVRFDGFLGFPGGIVDEGEISVANAVNREFQEEMGLNLDKFSFSQDDHVVSHVNPRINLVTHFYAREVKESEFVSIEKATLDAPEWGIETFGVIRVPMFIAGDGYRGFPVFLANKFAGNAKEQMIIAIQRKEILEKTFLTKVLEAAHSYIQKKSSS